MEDIPHSLIDFSKAQVFIVVDIKRSPDFIPSCCLLWGREVGKFLSEDRPDILMFSLHEYLKFLLLSNVSKTDMYIKIDHINYKLINLFSFINY